MKTVADQVAETLAVRGVEVVFGLPGGENVALLDAIRRENIDFVLVRNESSAVFMADAHARLTGQLGVCLTTLGPGATNACVGVAHAFLERSPVLVLTAQTIDSLLGRHTHQVIDLHALFTPITKFSGALDGTNVQATLDLALTTARSARPGPVHLALSSERATEPVVEPVIDHTAAREDDAMLVNSGGHPDPVPARGRDAEVPWRDSSQTALAAAGHLLAQSRRPVIVAGLGLEPDAPYAQLRALAESLQAPVIVTPKAKGAIPADHPLAAGVIGLTRTDPAYAVLDEADCIVAVGFDVVELVKPWQQHAPLIWVAPWANADPTIDAVATWTGPMKPALAQLTGTASQSEPTWGTVRVAALRTDLAAVPLPAPQPGRMRPQAVLAALRAATPKDTLIATDVGSHKILAALDWPAYTPNRYLVSNGLSAMGYGVSAAIAGARALRQPTIALTGDAGLAMVMGELALMREMDLPVIVVVMNDSALDLIRSAQVRADRPVHGTEFHNPDFGHIAQAFGLAYARVANEAEALAAFAAAVSGGHPALVEALIDPSSYPTTPRTG